MKAAHKADQNRTALNIQQPTTWISLVLNNFIKCRWSIWTSFFDISRDVAMAINFVKMANSPVPQCSR